MTARSVNEIRHSHASRDGDGVAISRISGMEHESMDPILLIDELSSDNRDDFMGGFPTHPHRGMQTVTYVKNGSLSHEDSQGNRGEIGAGGVQWMSAGRGVLHSEMPAPDSQGLHAFQLWVNLPAAEKMSAPRYRDVSAAELATHKADGMLAVAIAGAWSLQGETTLQGPLRELAEQAALLDLMLPARHSVQLSTAEDEALLIYPYRGRVTIGQQSVEAGSVAILSSGHTVEISTDDSRGDALVIRGRPLREPVAHYGPFVMNTQQEIEQALADYRQGQFA